MTFYYFYFLQIILLKLRNHKILFWCIINSKFIDIETFGKNAVVCGRSKNVGMPMAVLLHADGIGETKAGIII